MKPFNIEAALRGEPVVTRNGREVTQITLFDIDGDYPVAGVIDKNRFEFSTNGKYLVGQDTERDLFMAPKKRIVWVNFYDDGCYYFHDNEKEANEVVGHLYDGRIGGKAYPLEIEE